ncbi:helix-turn-helix domain-containing protein [Amycolatopsis anabasis]|uniref:helix-turn-helix domain-containing protein n=1 Tax=Amycolatopsis anabasis TaxID=1840409 RepID=UPI00131CF310|nr:helix-turn-helix transcriptional regulator [Amycolatopsis anabasis]
MDQHQLPDDHGVIGRRLREIRSWRGLDLRTAAQLSGISHGYLGQLERGEKPINNRRVLEGLAMTYRVSPLEITGKPWAPTDAQSSEAHSALYELECALDSYELGIDPEVPTREWPKVQTDVDRLVKATHWASNYAEQGRLAPKLLGELHAFYVRQPSLRPTVLVNLLHAYAAAMYTTKRLGGRGLPLLAAVRAEQVAEEVDAPEWRAYSVWLRGQAAAALDRARHYDRAVNATGNLTGASDGSDAMQAAGMLHLNAALSAATQGNTDQAAEHLAEADTLADRMPDPVMRWASLWFGTVNNRMWRMAVAEEQQEPGKVIELAEGVPIDQLPSISRQAEYWATLARSLMGRAKTRKQGVAYMLKAEDMAPLRIRNSVVDREAVSAALRAVQRESGGQELRGLAWRMGVAPTGIASNG